MKILIRKYQGTIYPENNGYTGAIDLGFDGQGQPHPDQTQGQDQGDRQGKADPGRR